MKQPLAIYRDPVPNAHRGRRPKYPFARMQVGDCFYVPLKEVKSANVLASSARQWAKRNNSDRKFVTRVVGDIVGIWRVE
jgi:hypothetical protein